MVYIMVDGRTYPDTLRGVPSPLRDVLSDRTNVHDDRRHHNRGAMDSQNSRPHPPARHPDSAACNALHSGARGG